jgi:hypothetical protein
MRSLYFLCFFLVSINLSSQAQFLPKKHGPKDTSNVPRKTQFLLMLGANKSQLKLHNANWDQGAIDYRDSLSGIFSSRKTGLELGLGAQFNLSPSFAIRPLLYLGFQEELLTYNKITGSQDIKKTPVLFRVSIPALYKVKLAERIWTYVGAGPGFSFGIGSDTPEGEADLLALKKTYVSAEFLAGVDIHPRNWQFYLSPEFRVSNGLTNIKNGAPDLYSNVLKSVKRNIWSFSLIFKR